MLGVWGEAVLEEVLLGVADGAAVAALVALEAVEGVRVSLDTISRSERQFVATSSENFSGN